MIITLLITGSEKNFSSNFNSKMLQPEKPEFVSSFFPAINIRELENSHCNDFFPELDVQNLKP